MAHSTYFSEPSLIVRVPKGSGLHITVAASVGHATDKISLPFPWVQVKWETTQDVAGFLYYLNLP